MSWKKAVVADTVQLTMQIRFGKLIGERMSDPELVGLIPEPDRRQAKLWGDFVKENPVAYEAVQTVLSALDDSTLLDVNNKLHAAHKSLGNDAWKLVEGPGDKGISKLALFGVPEITKEEIDRELARTQGNAHTRGRS